MSDAVLILILVGIVCLGLGIMAYALNGWDK